MADVATRLRNFLLSKTDITKHVQKRIYEVKPVQHKPDPYIYFAEESSENADVLNGSVGDTPLFHGIPVIAVARSLEVAKQLNAAVRAALHLYHSTFDDTTAKGCFVDRQSAEEQAMPDGSASGYFIGTSDTRIFL